MRLKKRAEFLAVAKGQRMNSHALTLQAARRRPAAEGDQTVDGPRFGLTVTNKTGNSPERNRMRRRLREVLRLAHLSADPAFDYVIVARRAVLSLPFAELTREIARVTRRIHEPRSSKSSQQTRQV